MGLPDIETRKELKGLQDLLRKEIEKPAILYGSITALAKHMEIHPITLTRFLNGRSISTRILYKIYRICRTTPIL